MIDKANARSSYNLPFLAIFLVLTLPFCNLVFFMFFSKFAEESN